MFVKALLIVADFGAVRALLAVPGGQCPEAGLGRGSILGAVVLHHEIVYAMHGRMVGQVPPAGAGGATGAVRVGAQRRAEFRGFLCAQVVRTRRGRPELRVALEDLAWRRHCEAGRKHNGVSACVVPTLHVVEVQLYPPAGFPQPSPITLVAPRDVASLTRRDPLT